MRADAVDVRRTTRFDAEQQLVDLVAFEQTVDVTLDLDQASAPQVEVLADVAGLQLIRRPVMLADGALGGLDQLGGPLGSDQVAPVVEQLGQPFRRGAGEIMRSEAFGKVCCRLHAVQPAHVSGALGAHARDELSISETTTARPVQAALASAATFSVAAAASLVLSPAALLLPVVAVGSLVFLALLGMRAGAADVIKPMIRVTFWGALAMAMSTEIDAVFGKIL